MNGEGDLLSQAVAEVLTPVYGVDEEWPADKLQTKVVSYFANPAKKLETRQPWNKILQEYADKSMGTLFQVFAERPWFRDVDFLSVLDAGFRSAVPARVLNRVDNQALNEAVVAEYDKVYKSNMAGYIMWDACSEVTDGEEATKKIWNHLQKAWDNAKARVPDALDGDMLGYVEEFVRDWVRGTLAKLTLEVLNEDACAHLFTALMENMVLPVEFTTGLEEMPSDWKDAANAVVLEICALASAGELPDEPAEPPKKKKKTAASWEDDSHSSQKFPPNKFENPRAFAQATGQYGAAGGKGFRGRGRPRGHPRCVQGPECVGNPGDKCYRHTDGDVPGDIYCSCCWDIFAESDPTLEANYLRRRE